MTKDEKDEIHTAQQTDGRTEQRFRPMKKRRLLATF